MRLLPALAPFLCEDKSASSDIADVVCRLLLFVALPTHSRAGRFGTKGLAITFVSTDDDSKVLETIQSRFEVAITELPDTIEASTYSTSSFLLSPTSSGMRGLFAFYAAVC